MLQAFRFARRRHPVRDDNVRRMIPTQFQRPAAPRRFRRARPEPKYLHGPCPLAKGPLAPPGVSAPGALSREHKAGMLNFALALLVGFALGAISVLGGPQLEVSKPLAPNPVRVG